MTGSITFWLGYSGAIQGPQYVGPYTNTSASNQIDIINLASGDNTVTVPTGGTTPNGVLVVPPAGNATLIKAKGVGGDTGISLHKTFPSFIAVDSSVVSFILNAAGLITGVNLYWL